MSSRLYAITHIGLLAALCACAGPEATYTQYGEALTLTETTSISAIVSDPEAFLDAHVRVEGTVVGVCEMMGCWIELAGENDGEQIRVKVEDGVIVFPMTAMGYHARVEGVVEKVELTLEEAVEQAQHHAEERGEEFDPSTVTVPEVTYQIRGLGAEIEDATEDATPEVE